ncbi:hypothetical protein [Pseudoroseicyclus sp. CXY001]|uniref:hypothetical protein n=1 Tax=Pseudoroseicyclus sp. CXY001 TaxID=3242492 RepID=UPI0035715C0C
MEDAVHDTAKAAAEVIRDPVCGVTVDPAKEKATHYHHSRSFRFGSEGSRTKFAADPRA